MSFPSPLFQVGNPLSRALHAGCLDAPNLLTPTYECWMIRRENWLPPFDLEHHERDRS